MMKKLQIIGLSLLVSFSSAAFSEDIDTTDQPVINQAIKQNLNPKVAKLALTAYKKSPREKRGVASHS